MTGDFSTLMDAIRATFDAFTSGAISKRERTRRLHQHVAQAAVLCKSDYAYLQGYIHGRMRAQDDG